MVYDSKDAMKEKWNSMQKIGKKKFVFKYGVLRFGLVMAVIYLVVSNVAASFYQEDYNFWTHIQSAAFLKQLFAALVLWLLAGWWFGRSIWRSYRRRFKDISKYN